MVATRSVEEAPLAEATVAASLLLAASDDAEDASGTAGTGGLAAVTALHGHHRTSAIGHPEIIDEAFGQEVAGGVTSTAKCSPPNTPHEKRRDSKKLEHHGGDHEQSRCRVFDGLAWRQVRQDPSYAAGVVRDIKKALRAGQPVKMRSREDHDQQESSLGRASSADCQLMLRTLYMQCVPVSSLRAMNAR